MVATVSNILILQYPIFMQCQGDSILFCLESLMALIQVSIQGCCFIVLYIRVFLFLRFVLYFYYFPTHLKFDYSAVQTRPLHDSPTSPVRAPRTHPHIIEYTLSPLWIRSLNVLYFVSCTALIIVATTLRLLFVEFQRDGSDERDRYSVAFASVLGVYDIFCC